MDKVMIAAKIIQQAIVRSMAFSSKQIALVIEALEMSQQERDELADVLLHWYAQRQKIVAQQEIFSQQSQALTRRYLKKVSIEKIKWS